ncbi:MAG: recombinase family protein, partial [Alphaproteobacteria bacterium]|nr:recombinase family protein [Alphaproteobacteria bacterium]
MTRKPTPAAAPVRKTRCAIYTRKSTDEGLDKEFNTLHAQRDACSSYIASQRHEGWIEVPDYYDDGGYSGGNLDRPALRRLLADIAAGRIDVVVTYKLDRLSRSLTDFVRQMEVMEAHNTTFVSITQSFNTTTSMGRLTLNILLSFAQYEREIIGERIRDKFAASRARGMWMGGKVPLGYRVEARKLVVVEEEAKQVRSIFERFLVLRSATKLAHELRGKGIRSKTGATINKGYLYRVLANRTYLGEATHKGKVYPGEHTAIVPRELWDRVHSIMQISPRTRANGNRTQSPALLKGLLFGLDGRALSPTHCRKGGKQYRYYVAQEVLKDEANQHPDIIRRISAAEIEAAVLAQIRALVRQPEVIVGTLRAAR